MKSATARTPAAKPRAKSAAKSPSGNPAPADPAYLRLVRQYPLRPIRDPDDYGAAAAMLDRLVLRDDLGRGESDYLAVLTDLVEDYDRKHFPPAPDRRPPHERLRSLMAEAGVSPAELQTILGIAQSTVSMILSGKRGLSKATAIALGKRFRLNPAYFL